MNCENLLEKRVEQLEELLKKQCKRCCEKFLDLDNPRYEYCSSACEIIHQEQEKLRLFRERVGLFKVCFSCEHQRHQPLCYTCDRDLRNILIQKYSTVEKHVNCKGDHITLAGKWNIACAAAWVIGALLWYANNTIDKRNIHLRNNPMGSHVKSEFAALPAPKGTSSVCTEKIKIKV